MEMLPGGSHGVVDRSNIAEQSSVGHTGRATVDCSAIDFMKQYAFTVSVIADDRTDQLFHAFKRAPVDARGSHNLNHLNLVLWAPLRE